MNEKTNSLIRHILTALSTVFMLVGLSKFSPILQYLIDHLDALSGAIATVISIATAIYGFFFRKTN